MESRIAGVTGSDDGKPDRRSNRFRRWKAGSQEYRVQTMESWIAGVTGSDDGKPDRRSIGFGRWKAGSQEYQIRAMENQNLQRAQKALSTQSSNLEVSFLIFASAVTLM